VTDDDDDDDDDNDDSCLTHCSTAALRVCPDVHVYPHYRIVKILVCR